MPAANCDNLRHNLYFLQTFQVLILFLLQSVQLSCYNFPKEESEVVHSSHHLSIVALFHLLSAPISTLAVILAATTAHKALFILYLPFRYLYLFVLVGAALEAPILIYLPLLLLELCLQAALHAYIIRRFREGGRSLSGENSSGSEFVPENPPPPYGAVVSQAAAAAAASTTTVVKSAA